jgi:hypothetical protein
MKRYSLLVAMLFVLVRPLSAAGTDEPDAEAKRGLTLLQQYITASNYKDFGLSSAEEISQLQVGSGVDVFYVLNDDLKKFHGGLTLSELMRPSQTRFYPVTLKGQGKFLITVRFRDGKWKFASFEETDSASGLVQLMKGSELVGDKNATLYAVEIPALHLSYAALSKPAPGRPMSFLALNRSSLLAVRPGAAVTTTTYMAAISGVLDGTEVFGALSEKAKKITVATKP